MYLDIVSMYVMWVWVQQTDMQPYVMFVWCGWLYWQEERFSLSMFYCPIEIVTHANHRYHTYACPTVIVSVFSVIDLPLSGASMISQILVSRM